MAAVLVEQAEQFGARRVGDGIPRRQRLAAARLVPGPPGRPLALGAAVARVARAVEPGADLEMHRRLLALARSAEGAALVEAEGGAILARQVGCGAGAVSQVVARQRHRVFLGLHRHHRGLLHFVEDLRPLGGVTFPHDRESRMIHLCASSEERIRDGQARILSLGVARHHLPDH